MTANGASGHAPGDQVSSRHDRPLTVASDPARRNRHHNPFNALLADALEAQGCRVVESTRRNRFRLRPDVLHIHWPQNALLAPAWRAAVGALADLAGYALQRLRGGALVWTAHNIHAHESRHPWMERMFMRCFVRLLSGVIYMSATSRQEAEAAFPRLRRVDHAVIAHGAYGSIYPQPRARAIVRAEMGIAADLPLVGLLGEIRPYKGPGAFLDAIAATEPGTLSWLMAGRFAGPAGFAETMHRRITALTGAGHRIHVVDRRLGDAEMVDLMEACDGVAFPYERVANSGAAVLALERGKVIIASDLPLFGELAAELGPQRVRIIAGPFRVALPLAASAPDAALATFVAARQWPVIAARTKALFRTCLRR